MRSKPLANEESEADATSELRSPSGRLDRFDRPFSGRYNFRTLEQSLSPRRTKLVPQDSLESDHCAEMLRALADPVRLRIIDALRCAPKCVSELSKSLQVEVVTVSHHLGILHAVGLVEREKKGRFKVYRLRPGIVGPANRGQGKQHIDLGCCRLEIPPATGNATDSPAADADLLQLKSRSPAKGSPSASSKPRIPSV